MDNGIYVLTDLSSISAGEPVAMNYTTAEYRAEQAPQPWMISDSGIRLSTEDLLDGFVIDGRIQFSPVGATPESMCCSNPDIHRVGEDTNGDLLWCGHCGTLHHEDIGEEEKPYLLTKPVDLRLVPLEFADGFYFVYDRADRRFTIAERSTVPHREDDDEVGSWQILGRDEFIIGDDVFVRSFIVHNPVGLES